MASDLPAGAPPREVLFVTRKWAPAMGGMETYCHNLVDALAGSTTLDLVFLPGHADGGAPPPLALLAFPIAVLKRWFSRPKVPDVLHIADMALWPLGLLALLAFGRTKVVLSAHGTDVSYHRRQSVKGKLYGAYLRSGARLLRKATVIANSRATRAAAEETGWRNAKVIPLATGLRGPAPDGSHDGSLLFAGRLVERKGAAWFIREVLPGLPDGIRLKIAGTVWHRSEEQWLQDARIDFLGRLGEDELAQAYARAMCVVVPNIPVANGEYEGFGLVAPEAASAGGVVIASACDGLLDAVIDGTTGLLAAPGDAADWRRRIMAVAQWDREQRRAFLARAQSSAAEHFSWGRVARQTLEAYQSGAGPEDQEVSG